MPNIKKCNYVQLCTERGLTYLKEENPHLWFVDDGGFTHRVSRTNFRKSNHVGNIKTVCGSKEDYFMHNFFQSYPECVGKVEFGKFVYTGALSYSIVTCSKHGDYKTKPNWLNSRGMGCDLCANESTSKRLFLGAEGYTEKALQSHPTSNYDYSKTDYMGCRVPIVVGCLQHGDFEVIAYRHLQGLGCPSCSSVGGYSRSDYVKLCPKGSSVYLFRFKSPQESFYKIGISKNLKYRAKDLSTTSGCEVTIVDTRHFTDAGEAWDLEKKLHMKYKGYSHKPTNTFSGSTECFIYDDKITLDH